MVEYDHSQNNQMNRDRGRKRAIAPEPSARALRTGGLKFGKHVYLIFSNLLWLMDVPEGERLLQ